MLKFKTLPKKCVVTILFHILFFLSCVITYNFECKSLIKHFNNNDRALKYSRLLKLKYIFKVYQYFFLIKIFLIKNKVIASFFAMISVKRCHYLHLQYQLAATAVYIKLQSCNTPHIFLTKFKIINYTILFYSDGEKFNFII